MKGKMTDEEWTLYEKQRKEEIKAQKKKKRERLAKQAARRPELGTWHLLKNEAIKTHIKPKTSSPNRGVKWESSPITPIQGMYIGYRYKFDGYWEQTRDYDDGEFHNYFEQTETIEVWVFVTHANRNPIEVVPFDCGIVSIGVKNNNE